MMMNITETLGLTLPVFQAPLSYYPGQEKLVAAVSKSGALGILCANHQDLSPLEDRINAIQSQTDKAFAVMIDVTTGDDKVDLADRSQVNSYLKKAYQQLEIDSIESQALPHVDELIQVVIENRPAVIIFQHGLPSDKIIKQCKACDILVMAVASNTLEAIAAAQVVDAVILQGMESAGIQSRFNNQLNTTGYPLGTLLHHALAHVNKPLIVWGDAQLPQHVVAYLINGASAVVLDSLFWTTSESPIPPSYRQALLTQHNEMQTCYSHVWSGQPAQCLKNTLIQSSQKYHPMLAAKKQQRLLLPIILSAIAQDNPEFMPMWAGLCAVTTEKTTEQLCSAFLTELNEMIHPA